MSDREMYISEQKEKMNDHKKEAGSLSQPLFL